MKKNALTVTVGILLVIYSLLNFGAGYGQFSKAQFVGQTTSFMSSLGDMAGDKAMAKQWREDGTSVKTGMYLVALFILATAVLGIVASVGLFSGNNWAFMMLIIVGVCGFLVEMQDIAEDGFGVGKMIFLAINALALVAAFSARETRQMAT